MKLLAIHVLYYIDPTAPRVSTWASLISRPSLDLPAFIMKDRDGLGTQLAQLISFILTLQCPIVHVTNRYVISVTIM